MIKFSNFPTTVLLRVADASDTTLYVDSERLRSYPSVAPSDDKEGIFFVMEDIYGHYEACYASQIDYTNGILQGVRRGLGNMPAQDWHDLSNFVRVEIRPSAQVMQRMIQRDGDTLHGGWWDSKVSDPWASSPTFATKLITMFNDMPSADPPQHGVLEPGQLAIYREKKTLWFGDKGGNAYAIQGGANNVVNVMDHGADNTGNVSASAEIKLAVAEAIKRKACLFFPAGTYKIIEPIRIDDPAGVALAIHGCGMRSTIILATGLQPWCAFHISNPKFISIRDMSITTDTTSSWGYLAGPRAPTNFDKNVLDPTKGSTAIYIDGQHSWSAQVYRASEYVVQIDGVEFSGTEHSNTTGWAFGVALDSTGNAVVQRCVFIGHIRDSNAPASENTGGQSGVVRFHNGNNYDDLLITGCLAVGYTSMASCKGLANSIQMISNTTDQTARLFSSTRLSGDPVISMKFVKLSGNVVNAFWAFASIHNAESASITGNWCRTSGENRYYDELGDPLPQYDLLSVAAFSAMISGNYFEHVDTNVDDKTDLVAIRLYDSCKQAIISGNSMKHFNLGLMLDDDTVGCERHMNTYMPNQRVMADTDGKVWDKSPKNIKPIGGTTIILLSGINHPIPSGGSTIIEFKDKHMTVNELGAKTDAHGYLVLPLGIERIALEGLLMVGPRSEYSEVKGEIMKKRNIDANTVEVAAEHYYGKSAAVLSPRKSYINNPDHEARFTLRVLNHGPEPILLRGNASLTMTVLGYEE